MNGLEKGVELMKLLRKGLACMKEGNRLLTSFSLLPSTALQGFGLKDWFWANSKGCSVWP